MTRVRIPVGVAQNRFVLGPGEQRAFAGLKVKRRILARTDFGPDFGNHGLVVAHRPTAASASVSSGHGFVAAETDRVRELEKRTFLIIQQRL